MVENDVWKCNYPIAFNQNYSRMVMYSVRTWVFGDGYAISDATQDRSGSNPNGNAEIWAQVYWPKANKFEIRSTTYFISLGV